jgi:hypothetical protein
MHVCMSESLRFIKNMFGVDHLDCRMSVSIIYWCIVLFVAAVVVRYLTKRYIGEYSSTGGECDFYQFSLSLYRGCISFFFGYIPLFYTRYESNGAITFARGINYFFVSYFFSSSLSSKTNISNVLMFSKTAYLLITNISIMLRYKNFFG